MTVLSGQTIRRLNIITPFVEGKPKAFGMSYGLSVAGYDIRTSDKGGKVVLCPGDFYLLCSLEKFTMPWNVIGVVHDKSTWARLGLAVQNTVLEPGWHGFLTLEVTNHGHSTLAIEPGNPIAQILFHYTDEQVENPYNGKYQDQPQIPIGAIPEWE